MEENYRYIVYVGNEDTGFYSSHFSMKETNRIEDIIAIFKSEEKAKEFCKDRKDLEYRQIIWEE